jgi:hypothetical protein
VRAALILPCAALLGACDPPDTAQVASSVGNPADITFRYTAMAHVRTGAGRWSYDHTTQSAAYHQGGTTDLGALCSGGRDCIASGEVSVFPEMYLDGKRPADHDVVDAYGFAATFDKVRAVSESMLSWVDGNPAMRAVDVESSLSISQNRAADWLRLGTDVIGYRDELRTTMNKVPDRVAALGSAVVGAEKADLAATRPVIERARVVLDTYQSAVETQRRAFEALVADYRSYHGAEQQRIDSLESVVERSASADLAAMPGLLQEVVAVLRAESGVPSDLRARAEGIDGALASHQRAFDAAAEEFRELFSRKAIPIPDQTREVRDALARMTEYLDERQRRLGGAAAQVMEGLVTRKDALILAARDQATRQTIDDASRARAAAEFLGEATRRVDQVWRAQPVVAGVELLGARYQEVLALLQTEALCNVAEAPPWQSSGCGTYQRNRSRATAYLRTLPRVLRRGRDTLAGRGAAAGLWRRSMRPSPALISPTQSSCTTPSLARSEVASERRHSMVAGPRAGSARRHGGER